MDDPDLALLARYARHGDEAAFAEVVRRYLGLVHSVALRHVRSPQLAEEVAQSAFADLARVAGRLGPGTVLPAWLWQVARRTAVDAVRREARRRQREQTAHELSTMNTPDADWSQIAPLLDEALQSLDETDRAVVVLRWFENKPLREVGAALGLGEDAAQKRASRALDRLREFFTRRGITVGAGGLAALISTNAVQAAPAGLAAVVTGGALTVGVAAPLLPTVLTMTNTTKFALVVALIVAAVAIPAYRYFLPASKPSRPIVTVAAKPVAPPDLAIEPAAVPPSAPASADNAVNPALLQAALENLLAQQPAAVPATPPSPTVPRTLPSTIAKISLTKAPLQMTLELLEQWSGRTVLWSAAMRKPVIELHIDQTVPIAEAISALTKALEDQGIGLVPEGEQMFKVVDLQANPAEPVTLLPIAVQNDKSDKPPPAAATNAILEALMRGRRGGGN